MTFVDPAERMRAVREHLEREAAKRRPVDHNGRPIDPQPEPEPHDMPPAAASAEPVRRLPAPNPALGSSATGAPDLAQQIAAAQKAGDWRTVVTLQRQQSTGHGFGTSPTTP